MERLLKEQQMALIIIVRNNYPMNFKINIFSIFK